MDKEQLINRHARNLKSLVGTGLAQDECKDIIKYAVNEALTLYGVSKRFSPKASTHVLNKPKTKYISKDLKNILEKHYGYILDSEEDIKFLNKYAGQIALVYEWCNDWWIAEDDNYTITEKCFCDID